MTVKLVQFEADNRTYRIMLSFINSVGDIEIYVEQYLYDNRENGNQIWVEVPPGLIDKNKMTIDQCAEILSVVSQYINENNNTIIKRIGMRGVLCKKSL